MSAGDVGELAVEAAVAVAGLRVADDIHAKARVDLARLREDGMEAEALAPDFLFCNHTRIPDPSTPLWPGPWQWAFYEVTDPALALDLARRGATLVETMALDAFTGPPWSLTIADEP